MVVAIMQTMEDVVYLYYYEDEYLKGRFIGNGVIHNVAGGMLHRKVIGKIYVLLTITKSYEDDNPLFDPLTRNNPPVITIGQAKGNYILWSSVYVRLYSAT